LPRPRSLALSCRHNSRQSSSKGIAPVRRHVAFELGLRSILSTTIRKRCRGFRSDQSLSSSLATRLTTVFIAPVPPLQPVAIGPRRSAGRDDSAAPRPTWDVYRSRRALGPMAPCTAAHSLLRAAAGVRGEHRRIRTTNFLRMWRAVDGLMPPSIARAKQSDLRASG
jgi:hypothetical protein